MSKKGHPQPPIHAKARIQILVDTIVTICSNRRRKQCFRVGLHIRKKKKKKKTTQRTVIQKKKKRKKNIKKEKKKKKKKKKKKPRMGPCTKKWNFLADSSKYIYRPLTRPQSSLIISIWGGRL